MDRLMVPFLTSNPAIDETPLAGESPFELVERLALEKAMAVAAEYPDALVIGSDQVAMHGQNIVGKPGTHENAVAQLRQASGKSVKLFTGLALVNARTGSTQSLVEPFTVHFRELSTQQIENYLRKEQPYNCAGSVKSEGLGVAVIKKFEGDDPASLIGLPLIRLISLLENERFDVLA